MTTQKVQSKIKTSTIAITVLSILLAVAVASTIVLAAFTANKSATTTITFGGGLTLTLGSDGNDNFAVDTTNDGTETANLTLTPQADAVGFSGVLTLPNIKGSTNLDAVVGVKVGFEYSSNNGQNWTAMTVDASGNFASAAVSEQTINVTVTKSTALTQDTTNKAIYVTGKMTADASASSLTTLFTSFTVSSTNDDTFANYKVRMTLTFTAKNVISDDEVTAAQTAVKATLSA